MEKEIIKNRKKKKTSKTQSNLKEVPVEDTYIKKLSSTLAPNVGFAEAIEIKELEEFLNQINEGEGLLTYGC